MTLSIYSILTAAVLVLNALAILSDSRLLSKIGLHADNAPAQRQNQHDSSFVPQSFIIDDVSATLTHAERSAMKAHIASVLSSVRTLTRWPLILVNIMLILSAIVFS